MPTAPVTPPRAAPVGGGVAGYGQQGCSHRVGSRYLKVAVGASQTISVSFTSTDGLPISGFSVYGSLGTLPAGWSAPSSLTCAIVGPGNGCVLALTYTPPLPGNRHVDPGLRLCGQRWTGADAGTLSDPSYAAVPTNNIVASVSPAGEVDAAVGGSKQTVTIDFTTDDGNAATALIMT